MKKHIFFDLDGTITDSKAGIVRAAQHALQTFRISMTEEELLPFIGPPLQDSFGRIFPHSPEKVELAKQKYREYYAKRGIFECRLYEGIAALLHDLCRAGHSLCLATSKPEVFAHRILEHFSLSDCFFHVAGAELSGPRNSKPDVLRHACALCGAEDMQHCLMVGDRKYDVCGAHELGMDCAAVLYGYGSRRELEEAGAQWLCQTVEDLRRALFFWSGIAR